MSSFKLVFIMILFIILLLMLFVYYKISSIVKEYKKNWEEIREKIREANYSYENKLREYNNLLKKEKELKETEASTKQSIDNLINFREEQLGSLKNLSSSAFEEWFSTLEYNYKDREIEYNKKCNELIKKYQEEANKVDEEIEAYKEKICECKEELNKIKATRDASIAAARKEQEIKDSLSFYCLTPSQKDIEDIQKLERVKLDLHNPRILSMLIWSVYFQKPMNTLCNNVLGTKDVTGIYKITNQKNGLCYIGQSKSVARRFKDHAKCGLGIDTPSSSKLYKAMQEDGIWNFSWELLEECNPAELNEKEHYYIDLYQSCEYGYNSNLGISKTNK